MSISDRQRRAIFEGLETIMGPDAADDLLTMLPNQPAAELVTRDDLNSTTIRLQGEMAELRGDMAELRAEVKTDIAVLRSEVKHDLAELRVTMQRWMSGAMATNTVALVVALVT